MPIVKPAIARVEEFRATTIPALTYRAKALSASKMNAAPFVLVSDESKKIVEFKTSYFSIVYGKVG